MIELLQWAYSYVYRILSNAWEIRKTLSLHTLGSKLVFSYHNHNSRCHRSIPILARLLHEWFRISFLYMLFFLLFFSHLQSIVFDHHVFYLPSFRKKLLFSVSLQIMVDPIEHSCIHCWLSWVLHIKFVALNYTFFHFNLLLKRIIMID